MLHPMCVIFYRHQANKHSCLFPILKYVAFRNLKTSLRILKISSQFIGKFQIVLQELSGSGNRGLSAPIFTRAIPKFMSKKPGRMHFQNLTLTSTHEVANSAITCAPMPMESTKPAKSIFSIDRFPEYRLLGVSILLHQ